MSHVSQRLNVSVYTCPKHLWKLKLLIHDIQLGSLVVENSTQWHHDITRWPEAAGDQRSDPDKLRSENYDCICNDLWRTWSGRHLTWSDRRRIISRRTVEQFAVDKFFRTNSKVFVMIHARQPFLKRTTGCLGICCDDIWHKGRVRVTKRMNFRRRGGSQAVWNLSEKLIRFGTLTLTWPLSNRRLSPPNQPNTNLIQKSNLRETHDNFATTFGWQFDNCGDTKQFGNRCLYLLVQSASTKQLIWTSQKDWSALVLSKSLRHSAYLWHPTDEKQRHLDFDLHWCMKLFAISLIWIALK